MSPSRGLRMLAGRAPRGRMAALALLILAGSLTEGAGFLLIVPLLSVLFGQQAPEGPARVLTEAMAGIGVAPTVEGLLAAFVAVIAARAAIQFLRERTGLLLSHEVVDGLRAECAARLMRAEWRWTSGRARADHLALIVTEVNRIGIALRAGVSLASGVAALAAFWIAAALVSPRAALALALVGLASHLALRGVRRGAERLGAQQTRAARDLMAQARRSIDGLKLAKILGEEGRHAEALGATVARLRAAQVRFGVRTSAASAAQQVAAATLLAGALYLGIEWLALPLPELLALSLLFARLVPLGLTVQRELNRLLNALPALDAVDAFLAESAVHAEPEPPSALAAPAMAARREIRLDGVTLHHPGRGRPALDRVDLALPAGATVAVTGPSGSGKSTLADVLIGLTVPDAGTLTVDGRAVSGAARHAWRRSVSYMPQETMLLADTVRANLLMARPDAGDAELHAALERAAAGFVHELPGGLAASVGDDGERLSGGERQRIALARALLRRPTLLILDEATSALDDRSERAIAEALRAIRGDLTIVVIGHRPALLRDADLAVELEAGRVARCVAGARS